MCEGLANDPEATSQMALAVFFLLFYFIFAFLFKRFLFKKKKEIYIYIYIYICFSPGFGKYPFQVIFPGHLFLVWFGSGV